MEESDRGEFMVISEPIRSEIEQEGVEQIHEV